MSNLEKTEVELFEMQPGGCSPLHSHDAQHTVLVLEGEGAVSDGEKTFPLHVDDVIIIIADELHQFRNIGQKPLRFLCITADVKK
ncbi:MAG: cupin domain-containing protein [Candidatus Bathyarchaeota archaeon]|nr:cupin domain-containing protein [Candidatus Bathyarchaeota archaeon]